MSATHQSPDSTGAQGALTRDRQRCRSASKEQSTQGMRPGRLPSSWKLLTSHRTQTPNLGKIKGKKYTIFRRHRKLSSCPWDREELLNQDIAGHDAPSGRSVPQKPAQSLQQDARSSHLRDKHHNRILPSRVPRLCLHGPFPCGRQCCLTDPQETPFDPEVDLSNPAALSTKFIQRSKASAVISTALLAPHQDWSQSLLATFFASP